MGKRRQFRPCPQCVNSGRSLRWQFKLLTKWFDSCLAHHDLILTRDITERGLRAGDVGTVVERDAVPGVPEEGYSVEFFDMTGNTVAMVTLPASALRLPTPADRPAVRALSA